MVVVTTKAITKAITKPPPNSRLERSKQHKRVAASMRAISNQAVRHIRNLQDLFGKLQSLEEGEEPQLDKSIINERTDDEETGNEGQIIDQRPQVDKRTDDEGTEDEGQTPKEQPWVDDRIYNEGQTTEDCCSKELLLFFRL